MKQLTAKERYEKYELSGKNAEYRKSARYHMVPRKWPVPRAYGRFARGL